MIYFIGAGPGAPDLITVRGKNLLERADLIIYAGSLVNKELLKYAKPSCKIMDSASMTLEEVIAAMVPAAQQGQLVVRLHTGDPSIYGAHREQMDMLRSYNLEFEVVPGVSSFCACAAALNAEYTLPNVSQSVIITRMEGGRTPIPDREKLASYAAHHASMVIFLSSGMLEKVQKELCAAATRKIRRQPSCTKLPGRSRKLCAAR
jgi:precorrin-4/cobalt-precorrin-4 C11-methyltransferase